MVARAVAPTAGIPVAAGGNEGRRGRALRTLLATSDRRQCNRMPMGSGVSATSTCISIGAWGAFGTGLRMNSRHAKVIAESPCPCVEPVTPMHWGSIPRLILVTEYREKHGHLAQLCHPNVYQWLQHRFGLMDVARDRDRRMQPCRMPDARRGSSRILHTGSLYWHRISFDVTA
jgi:hypothetical protein